MYLIFLDCEFTDAIDCELISIGMISEDGLHEFYAERSDFNDSWCNHFVRAAVLPLLGRHLGAACNRDELSHRLSEWFATLPHKVQIACDSMHDRDLLRDAFSDELPINLDRAIYDLRSLNSTIFNLAVYRYHGQQNQPWHHALHDARALREGWIASQLNSESV